VLIIALIVAVGGNARADEPSRETSGGLSQEEALRFSFTYPNSAGPARTEGTSLEPRRGDEHLGAER
jgi:hypothetical protein